MQLHRSAWTKNGLYIITNRSKVPTMDIANSPVRLPITDKKTVWEQEFKEERNLHKNFWNQRWATEMRGNALVSYLELVMLKSQLYEEYRDYPYDFVALSIRSQINHLRKFFPRELEAYFHGDWDQLNDIQEQLNYVKMTIESSVSQKHLDQLLDEKEGLEREEYLMRLLIGQDFVPRTVLIEEDIPKDLADDPIKYQKPKPKMILLRKKPWTMVQRRLLFSPEKELSSTNLEKKKRKARTLPDPHDEFFSFLQNSREHDNTPMTHLWSPEMNEHFKENFDLVFPAPEDMVFKKQRVLY